MAESNQSYKKSSFGPAFLFLSKRQRRALANYYEFCRLMDDIVDEPTVTEPAKALDYWQEEVNRIFDGKAETPLGKQLIVDVKDFKLIKDRFLLLIEGMRADLQGKSYGSLTELEWYLYRVAVVVGLATLDILDFKGPQAESLAKDLGGAVQLTNIIRDVSSDAQLGRVYLPLDLLAQEGLSREDVLAGREAEKRAKVLTKLAEVAEKLYDRAEQQMKRFPKMQMLPCRIMGCVYALNLAKIKRDGFISEQPIRLTKKEKLKGAFHACYTTFFA